jgi:hypothetical protein
MRVLRPNKAGIFGGNATVIERTIKGEGGLKVSQAVVCCLTRQTAMFVSEALRPLPPPPPLPPNSPSPGVGLVFLQ